MKSTDKIDQDGEDALQEIAQELEQVAAEIRGRALRGRMVGDVAGAAPTLRALTQRVELLVAVNLPRAHITQVHADIL